MVRWICVGDHGKAGISLSMKSTGVCDIEVGRVKKFLLFYQKAIYKSVKILYNIYRKKREVNDMLKIKFEYRDEMSRGEWREQECIVSSVEECKRIYGLGIDCDYRIISVEEL